MRLPLSAHKPEGAPIAFRQIAPKAAIGRSGAYEKRSSVWLNVISLTFTALAIVFALVAIGTTVVVLARRFNIIFLVRGEFR
jgi:hypothetical protein